MLQRIDTLIDASVFAARRARLAAAMGDGVAVVPTAPERVRNRDSLYPYRYDSYFYYLTGFTEPEAVLVLVGGAAPRSILFCREKDPEREIWDGRRFGPEGAREAFEFDEAHAISALDAQMPGLLADQVSLCVHMGEDPVWDARVLGWINEVRSRARSGVAAPQNLRDVRALIDQMRLFKDAYEIACMRKAASLSAEAHRRAMQSVRPGAREFEIEAELLYVFRRGGAQAPAYTSIVAGGENACVLHYVENDQPLNAGDLLLIDAGCEFNGYASDITRTFPIDGRFSGAQKAVYEWVLEAQRAAIEASRPGARWNDPHDAAVKVLVRGLIDLGLCHGSVDGVIESGGYRRFYMHRTGHWLGLDVHDAGDYKRNAEWRVLQPGMTFTVEPGCYIRPAQDVPTEFWNIGVRIEDDVLVTQDGIEILSHEAPKTIADIEMTMAAR